MNDASALEWLDADERVVVVPAEVSGERIDRFLAATLPDLSRAQVQRLIEQGMVLYAGRPTRASQPVRPGWPFTSPFHRPYRPNWWLNRSRLRWCTKMPILP